jgi:LysR family transcriptional regulator, glycine cleavage system transcriptional activator
MPPLRALRAFEAVARHLSVRAAADELAVSPSAVSHQLRLLEERLGVRLFHRTGRRMMATDAGRSYAQLIAAAFERIESATRQMVEAGFRDVLTIHCPPSLAPAWLMPRLTDFMRRHPQIDVRLHATPEPPDFYGTNVDVEIRYGDGVWPGMHVVRVLPDRVTPMLAPGLLATLPERPAAADLAQLPLIHSERSLVRWGAWLEANAVLGVDTRRGLRFDRGYLSIQAAVAGLGVALESEVFACRELASGALVAPLGRRCVDAPTHAHYLVCPPGHARLPKVTAFTAWMLDQAKGDDQATRGPA